MVSIQSASFGDDFASTNVLKSLQDKLASGGAIDMTVDSSIIPLVDRASGVGTTTLSGPEQAEVKALAEDVCGPSDQTCLDIKTQEFAEKKTKEKETANINSANIVKGRRLTVTYTDANGQTRTAKIPEGQKFALGEKAGEPDPGFDYESAMSPWKNLAASIWAVIGTAVLTFLYVSSIVITLTTYTEYGMRYVTIAMTALSAVLPLSGFGLSFFAPAIAEFIRANGIVTAKVAAEEGS
jgi:hypothetical protein